MTDPNRWNVAELIAALRESAKETASLAKVSPLETVEGQAADVLQEWRDTLQLIADGAPQAREVAKNALKITD